MIAAGLFRRAGASPPASTPESLGVTCRMCQGQAKVLGARTIAVGQVEAAWETRSRGIVTRACICASTVQQHSWRITRHWPHHAWELMNSEKLFIEHEEDAYVFKKPRFALATVLLPMQWL